MTGMTSVKALSASISRHMPSDGMRDCALPRVILIRSSSPTMPMPVVYEPSICLVTQGRKRVVLGDQMLVYDAERYLIATIELPVVGSVIEATADVPYLCLQYKFDLSALSSLSLEAGPLGSKRRVRGLALDQVTPALLDAFARLLALLDMPADIPVLAPLIEREILYRLSTGPASELMRHIASTDSSLARVARAIGWIKAHYRQPFTIEALSELAGMSPSSLHAHFKAATRMSPLQYRSQLRLQEARRLMVGDGLEAAQAGFRVGYESPSQFSREYVRLYGTAPATDAARVRREGGIAIG
jgi:AraC-like DNA-binding protein